MPSGLLLVDKPEGVRNTDCVRPHTGCRFAALAIIFRSVRTKKSICKIDIKGFEEFAKPFMYIYIVTLVKIPAANAALVGDQKKPQPVFLPLSQGFTCSGQEFDFFRAMQVMFVGNDGAVPIKEDVLYVHLLSAWKICCLRKVID